MSKEVSSLDQPAESRQPRPQARAVTRIVPRCEPDEERMLCALSLVLGVEIEPVEPEEASDLAH